MKDFLIECARELNLEITGEPADKFVLYKEMLLEWNEKMNLTAITDETDIVLKHFIDSVSLLTAIDIKDGDKVADIGTGAGFPGIPVKILKPGCDMTLIDSLNKRVGFLNHVIERLSLAEIQAIHMRAEDAAHSDEYRERFDLCVSRAVANLAALAEYCLPLVKTGGMFAALKGPDVYTELESAKKAINTVGGEFYGINKIEIPKSGIIHNIIVIKKIKQTPPKYPRKAVNISKKPI